MDLHYLTQIQRGIDFVEANLDFDVDAADVARHAGFSRWHFQRIFKALTNETLKKYIRSRRFSKSLEKLKNTSERILDISLSAGFESQESFTRAFKLAFGVTPAEYRRARNPVPFAKKIRFDAAYLGHLHRGVSLQPSLYTQRALKLVGMRTQFFGVDSEKNNLANKLPTLWDTFLKRADEIVGRVPELFYGVVQQQAADSDVLEYCAAVEVSDLGFAPKGMVEFTVPSTQYAKFAHRGAVSGVDQTVNYVYSSWLLNSGMQHTLGCDLEFYGPEYHPTSEESVMHYAIPVVGRVAEVEAR